MDVDPIERLVELGLVSPAEAMAARTPAAGVGRFGRLALLGVNVDALLPRLAEIAQIPLAPADVIAAVPSNAPLLPPELRAALVALPASPVFRAGQASVIVICDPATRARVRELLGPTFAVFLATEAQVRALAARFLVQPAASALTASGSAPVSMRPGGTGPLGSASVASSAARQTGPLAPPSGPGGTLKEAAEAHFGAPVEKAVITVPAYFNDGQRQATKDAGRIAGLDVLRIISEPTSAALAYGLNKHKERTRVVVYDLGGGTFDVSVLDIVGGTFEVVATSGDTYLGGDDFDLRIVDWLFGELKKEHKVEPRADPIVLQRVRDAAEKAKIDLSTSATTAINLPFLYSSVGAAGTPTALHLMRELTREQFEALARELVLRSMEITAKMLEDAKIPLHSVNEVVLVGGMTRMPAIRNAVRDYFGVEPAWNVNPDEVVALGAAIHANGLVQAASGGSPDMLLLDVTPHNLGILIAGGYFRTLVAANSTVPTSASHVFTTVQDDQTTVKIVVMQGASNVANNNEVLGEFTLTNLPAGPRGSVEIEVSFDISAEGIVFVSGTNLATGEEQSIEVTANDRLTDAEIQHLIRESNRFAVVDKQQGEDLVKSVKQMVSDMDRMIPIARAALAASGRDVAVLQQAQTFLMQTSNAVIERDYGALEGAREQLVKLRSVLEGLGAR